MHAVHGLAGQKNSYARERIRPSMHPLFLTLMHSVHGSHLGVTWHWEMMLHHWAGITHFKKSVRECLA